MMSFKENRFQDFFEDEKYVALKNYLYNYLLRKRAVEKVMRNERKGFVLEIGSGISPVLTSWNEVVYSDLSFSALRTLQQLHGKGHYVVADGMNLPFKADAFSHIISSEVMEHISDDRKALREIAGVTKQGGSIVVTFPHRHFYFSFDDRFVHHYRRYELSEMDRLLRDSGFDPFLIQKVLGPLEKITMLMVTVCISILQRDSIQAHKGEPKSKPANIMIRLFQWCNRLYAGIARIDAVIMPLKISTVLLIKAVKR
jgi:ubiquinone/menaquinone biosynthesis C-methylase UbiE